MAQPCFTNLCSATGAGRGDEHSAAVSLGTGGNFGIFYLLQWTVTEWDPPQTRLEGSSAFSCPVQRNGIFSANYTD